MEQKPRFEFFFFYNLISHIDQNFVTNFYIATILNKKDIGILKYMTLLLIFNYFGDQREVQVFSIIWASTSKIQNYFYS